jgi:hypothetical protein
VRCYLLACITAVLCLCCCGAAEQRTQLRAACQAGDRASCIDYADALA